MSFIHGSFSKHFFIAVRQNSKVHRSPIHYFHKQAVKIFFHTSLSQIKLVQER